MNRILCIALAVVLLTFGTAAAEWPEGGIHVTAAPYNQNNSACVVDDAGNTTIVWQDYRNGIDYDLYASRYDSWGNVLWADVPVCTTAASQTGAELVADGQGGVIITWTDARAGDYDIYAQRLDGSGLAQWPTNGVVICSAASDQTGSVIVSDGVGGAVIAWMDERAGYHAVFVQRVNALGATYWIADGYYACNTSANRYDLDIAPTEDGGAVLTWRDNRLGDYNIYAQRMYGAGGRAWTAHGELVCGAVDGQYYPQIIGDGNKGAFIVWQDYRGGTYYDIYAQHMNYNGYDVWTPDGEVVCATAANQRDPQLCSDGDGGFVVTWQDERNAGSSQDIYAQRLDYWGNRLWTADGLAVCTVNGVQNSPVLCASGNGGAVVVWPDNRYGTQDIYAQLLNPSGVAQWTAGGARVLRSVIGTSSVHVVSDGAGGAIVGFQGMDEGAYWSPFLQRVDRFGNWGYPAARIVRADDIPGDQGGLVNVEWDASRLDPWPEEAIDHYSVWRSISPQMAAAMVERGEAAFTTGSGAPGAESIRVQELAGVSWYWENVHEVAAEHRTSYSAAVPTLFDSTSTTQDPHFFQVMTHAIAAGQYWLSEPVPAWSGDNIAPAAPLALAAARVAADVALQWNSVVVADLGHYAVYRSQSSGFTPGPATFLTTVLDTMLVDTSADPAQTLYYRVTAVDVHENESVASNEAVADIVSAVGGRTPALTRLTVLANAPNPFGGSTEWRIGLPADAEVTIDVFDVAGRRVADRAHTLSAGWQRVRFDGRDNDGRMLPSGVYFYRVHAAGDTQTRKMVIHR